jgi:excisionase family DNA binding protein
MNENSINNLKLLSIKDLAKFFNISKVTAYRIVEGRKIPFYKINGCIRFMEKDILKYLEENRVEPIKYK